MIHSGLLSSVRYLILFHMIVSSAVSELQGCEEARADSLLSALLSGCVCVCRVTREQDIIEVYGIYTAERSSTDDIPYVFFVSNIYSLALYTHTIYGTIYL